MAGQASSRHHPHADLDAEIYNVRVAYPINDNSSREIRDNILLDFFGYIESDIKALDEQKEGYFYISDKSTPTKWATREQVKSWNFNLDETVRVNMSQMLIKNLTVFREQRATLEIFKVGMFIADTETRQLITEDLENILSAAGDKRINALNNLMVTIGGSPSKYQIFQALRFLSSESGYKNNPFLLIAMARTSIYTSDTPSIGSNEVNQSSIAAAVKAANDRLYNSASKSDLAKISKLEAAAINYWASDLYSQSNAEAQANQRKWVERFLNMSEKERLSLKEGDVIEEFPAGATVMRTPSPLEKDYDSLLQKRAQELKIQKEIDEGRQIVEPTTPNATNDINIQTPTKEVIVEKGSSFPNQQKKDAYPPQQKQPQQYTGRMVDERKFQNEINQINNYGNAAGLVLEYFRWQTFHQRMAALTNYLAAKEKLERQIQAEKTHVVPPRPEIVKAYIKDFMYHGRITVNPFEKRMIIERLGDLQVLLEESNALYR